MHEPEFTFQNEPPEGWWEEAFQRLPTESERKGHACGASEMLMIVAYDIHNPKTLSKIGKFCTDYGIRVQYSVFECRLEAERFEEFWLQLKELINPETDRIVAYRVCSACAKEILSSGTMELSTPPPIAYVF